MSIVVYEYSIVVCVHVGKVNKAKKQIRRTPHRAHISYHIISACHMSYVICHMSYVICRMSYVICHRSYVICRMSYVIYICHMSCVICHRSYVIGHMSYLRRIRGMCLLL
jgi:hypothetical protein